ncbi:MAG TPA: GntR family transcriptional regulator [Euzebya sp.]|nr:GntR family transcriptional regulator [Euzebya sp.]
MRGLSMLLRLDEADPRPLYEQIASALRRAVADEALAAGDRLPSGRDLAQSSGVTLETVQRAYRLLAEEGLVVSRVGRGTSVAPDLDRRALALDPEVNALVMRSRQLGLDGDAVLDLVRQRLAHGPQDLSTH